MNKEDQLVDLVIYAISQEVREREITEKINSTKIAKITRDVANELELNITHSWYKYGTYVWSDCAKIERMNQFLNLTPKDPSVNETINRAEMENRDLYQQIKNEVSEHVLIVSQTLSEFLSQLYNKAPKPFNKIYKANWKILNRFNRILKPDSDSYYQPQVLNASREITELHKAIFALEDYQDVIDLEIDFTSFLESLLVKHDFLLNDYELLLQFKPYLDDSYNYYYDTIWTLPSSIFTIATIKGPREESVIRTMRNSLSRTPYYVSEVETRIRESYKLKYYPTREENEAVMSRISSLLGEDKKIIDDFFIKSI